MSDRKVAIRIGTEGKAQVKADFAEIRRDGASAMQDIAAAARTTGDAGDAQAKRLATSFDRATQDLEAAARRQAAAAAKIASIVPKSAVQMRVEASSGTTARAGVVEQDLTNRSLGQYEGSARASAMAFRELFAEQEASERSALKLRAAIDPLFAAEQQLARSLGEVAQAEKAGILSADLLTQARQRAQAAYDTTRRAVDDAASPTRLGEDADAQVRAYYAASAAEAEKAQAAALRLKASIDPLWAAEQKLEQELRDVALAEKSGVLSADLLAAAQGRVRKEFDETTNAIKRQAGAGGGLSKMQKQTLLYTASDIIGSSANGINPGQLLIQQGPQVLQAFAAEEGGLLKLRALIGPVSVGVGALTALVIAGGAAWLDYSNATAKFNAIAEGSGRVIGATGAELEANAEAAAQAANISISAARDIEASYVSIGGIGKEVLGGLTALTNDFAAATGQDAAGAARELGSAFADPAAGAETLTARYGVLNQVTVSYIQQLVEQGDMLKAQRVLLGALEPAFDGAADHANVLALGWRNIKNWADEAWTAMGRAIDRAATGGALVDRIADTQRKLAAAREGKPTGYQGNAAIYEDAGVLEKQLADLQYQVRQEAARVGQARARATQQAAAGIVEKYTGADQLGDYRAAAGKLRAALKTDMPPDQRAETTEALNAYTHAIETFIPKQEKANQLSALDARLAAAKTPAEKAALAAQRARVESSGQVITAAAAEAAAQGKSAAAAANASRSGASRAATLAREAASMAANTRATLDLADAYLKSSAAGFTAEARRKALTEATRKGVDVEARVRAQIAQSIADGAASGARSVAQLRDETAARKAVNDNISAGTLAVAEMTTTLADEAALRPLLKLQAMAQGDAYDRLTKGIEAYRKALGDAHDEEARSNLRQALAGADEDILSLRDQAEFGDDRSGKGAVEIARRKAEREADRQRWKGDDRDDYVNNQVAEARTKLDTDRKISAAAAIKTERDRLTIVNAEIGLVGKSAEEHDRVIGRLQLQMQLADALGSAYDELAPAILKERDALDVANTTLKLQAASMDELRGFAGDLLDPTGWESWGDTGKSILNGLKAEFIKLALVNPLKNLINGNNALPGLDSVFSAGLKLFGGAAPAAGGVNNVSSVLGLPRNAGGTEYWSGGMTWVGENGPEVISAPRGSRITPAAQARQMVSTANDRQPEVKVTVMKSDLFDVVVERIATPIAAAAGQRAMVGGADMAIDRLGRKRRQGL